MRDREMPKPTPKSDLESIAEIVGRHPEGVTARELADALESAVPQRTLQHRLKQLVDEGRLIREGERRWTKYQLAPIAGRVNAIPEGATLEARGQFYKGGVALEADTVFGGEIYKYIPTSRSGAEIRSYLRQPPEVRKPTGYNRGFLDAYRPNASFYLSSTERAHLAKVGKPDFASDPAGTYARQILNRLLVDLSWNSSRLEGNTYSLLDTRRLIELGEEAEGRNRLEAQMIINHKDAIEFLVSAADDIGFNRYTVLNLHAILANNLLPDEAAAGRLRHIPVAIEKSVFHPLELPQLIEECFDQILATAAAIDDPFEQAFFVMTHVPYLQPFDDVNKRVSRLAGNIPFIKRNLSPLSFIDVPRSAYTDAILGVYELNRVDLLKDVFMWAYERSAARYVAVRQSLGEPDPFRLKHRDALSEVVGEVVRDRMDMRAAAEHVAAWTRSNIAPNEQERFQEIAESELLSLHEGNFARYRIRPAEYAAWRSTWGKPTA